VIELVVVGARGRLGSLVVAEAEKRPADFKIKAKLGRGDALDFAGASAVIDVSNASATASIALACAKAGVPLVVGTTGLVQAAVAALDDAARSIAVLHAANFSVSAHVAAKLVGEAATRLRAYDVEVVEAHHRLKKDAPSGTALMLANAARDARQSGELKRGRDGASPRVAGEIGVSAIRGGDVVGEHTVYFLGDGERIEIVHRVTDRAVFARGALAAAAYLVGKKPGRYAMADVISA
jgi:4-hydroxy-tetrahydrodipicolinate reductase